MFTVVSYLGILAAFALVTIGIFLVLRTIQLI
uniref:Cytochrome b6-f complex subunit 6 n=1 Tax=Mesostigma viride TaxID=41882 RepID=PETL_MESVI|nr:cytochrome b6/f complex subunit VI [Mesostigma viride]Q9MUN4.1 RecName: Full=Cytochrome b6-f complex subunit 6; AltName: Full=Cytochrome b6-f complex subunit PetL; AltName: Full=Cytochrome b6-f complex subunit VI [Mesostigma viride]AAF43866.1 subunit VI of cytochrome b6/f complex [Mesostigma viride]WKT08297.1 subunit VI of cytochrome b6/f complex [Mesostigma viride]